MGGKYDPRKPRRNPEIGELLRQVKRLHRQLQAETDHAARKGIARMLVEVLEMLAAEPEFLTDLRSGAQGDAGAFFFRDSYTVDPSPLSDQSPFADTKTGQCFIYAAGKVSPLFDIKDLPHFQDAYTPVRAVYWVWILEKVYATANETTMHVADESVFKNASGGKEQSFPPNGPTWLVLADPRGFRNGKCVELVAHYRREAAARKRADKLAAELNIRFVVARELSRIDTH